MSIEREYSNYHFEEYRVALVIDDFTHFEFNPHTATDEQFYERAEEQGTVFTLNGFENYIEGGEYQKTVDKLTETEYLFIGFIPFYRNENGIYCHNDINSNTEEGEEE